MLFPVSGLNFHFLYNFIPYFSDDFKTINGRKILDNIVGFLAAFCTTAAFVPQAVKVFRTKKTGDISLGMFLLMSVGVALWDVYGIIIGAVPVVTANSVTLVLSAYILLMKIKYDRKTGRLRTVQ